jgi:hypothetical protein
MKRRVLAFVLAVAIASGTQGALMYAAAGSAASRGVLDPLVQAPVAAPLSADMVSGAEALGGALTDSAIQCLRGGSYCFGYFSNNCCAEMAALAAVAGAVGAWLAAGVAAYYYYYYC